ncbi:hypothetical protein [Paradevosia shaoguanensis]|uniref:Peptidase M50 domain-containing protein n=1 Tax=Paradevosia shaoguanensis TaxID=1335043 RepID=A0AA41QKW1_9HYPH|nr:hypothetical protein [Paradevosia shaoguanensis]MCF1741166.1 hypothetical protein [Paradevosia shaoguanensis]MCI0125649.1 hypothetical protein [Paradevosia shaoguanensis]
MLNLTLWDLLIRLGAYLLVGAIAGILSQLVLRAFGGKTTSESGGPGFACFDIVGMVFALLFKQGWGRGPQPEPGGLRGGRIGVIAWVVLTLGLTLGALALLPYANRPIASFGNNIVTQAALSVLGAASDLGVWFVIVSLLPIPPLMGGNILLALFPGLRATARKLYLPGTALVALLVGFGIVQAVLEPVWVMLRGWIAL